MRWRSFSSFLKNWGKKMVWFPLLHLFSMWPLQISVVGTSAEQVMEAAKRMETMFNSDRWLI